jgi:hypothetical protein
MKRQATFLSIFAAGLLTVPAFAADGIIGVRWGKNTLYYEATPSGPQPVRNLSRRANGTGNAAQLVGDYRNPILKPEAAAIVRQRGDRVLAGSSFPNTEEQCRPIPPPFTLAMQLSFQMLPENDGNIVIVYGNNNNVRHIRMNASHPADLVPSPMGDSVGHWEGDTLVVDTIGVRTDAFTSADRFGTPQSEAMHVTERYRLIDGALAKAAQEKAEKSEGAVGNGARFSGIDPDTSRKGLQIELTMEDPNVFTAPLTVFVTYRPLMVAWQEDICADNPVAYYKDQYIGLPKADHPDF